MEDFVGALVCDHKNDRIPEEYNFFGKLVGVWDLDWNDHLHEAKKRRVKGEWIFSWVLEGMAIQDTFIVPSRVERLTDIQPDASYGTTIRIFNPSTLAWDIFWGEPGESIRLEAKSGSGNSFDGNHSAKYEVDIFGDNGYFFRLETDT